MAVINSSYNKLIQAFLYLMLISAALHIGVACLHFVLSGDVTSFNFFRIIELQFFYPAFVESSNGQYYAAAVALLVFIFSYIFLAKRKK
jgi:hypothetical protein